MVSSVPQAAQKRSDTTRANSNQANASGQVIAGLVMSAPKSARGPSAAVEATRSHSGASAIAARSNRP